MEIYHNIQINLESTKVDLNLEIKESKGARKRKESKKTVANTGEKNRVIPCTIIQKTASPFGPIVFILTSLVMSNPMM